MAPVLLERTKQWKGGLRLGWPRWRQNLSLLSLSFLKTCPDQDPPASASCFLPDDDRGAADMYQEKLDIEENLQLCGSSAASLSLDGLSAKVWSRGAQSSEAAHHQTPPSVGQSQCMRSVRLPAILKRCCGHRYEYLLYWDSFGWDN